MITKEIARINVITEWYYGKLQKIIDSSPCKKVRECNKNCSFCCNGAIILTYSEIIYIERKIRYSLNHGENIIGKLNKYLEFLSICDNYYDHKIPCIFLNNNNCSIYIFRPSTCRKYFSINKSFCIDNKKLNSFIDKFCIENGRILLKEYRIKLMENKLPNNMVDFHVGISSLLN